jgi:general secretion pathway protein G
MLQRIRERRDEGFTLIELLIVIIILGILATIVVFAVSGIRDRGQKSACKSEYKQIETAIETYYTQLGVFPADNAFTSLWQGGSSYGLLRTQPKYYQHGTLGAVALQTGVTDCAADPNA